MFCLFQKLRPVCNTECEKFVHQQIREQKEKEEELQKALHVKLYQARERRTEEKHRCILLEKYRRIKEARSGLSGNQLMKI